MVLNGGDARQPCGHRNGTIEKFLTQLGRDLCDRILRKIIFITHKFSDIFSNLGSRILSLTHVHQEKEDLCHAVALSRTFGPGDGVMMTHEPLRTVVLYKITRSAAAVKH